MWCRWSLVAVALSGCGYSVVRGDAPFGARRIAIVPFQEDEPIGLTTDLSRELAALLAADGVQITTSVEGADGVLTGVVLSSSTTTSPVARSGTRIPAYQMKIVVRAHLRDGDRELWETRVSASETFLPTESTVAVETQNLETEANRRRALHRMAITIARDLHQQLVVASSVTRAPEN